MAEQTIPENPPAFPESVAVDHQAGLNYSRNKGMTLRDYFAASALSGIVRDMVVTLAPDILQDNVTLAYRFADAMLLERERR